MEVFVGMLAKAMEDVGIRTEVFPTDGHVLICGEISGSSTDRSLLLFDHYVVTHPGRLEDWGNLSFATVLRGNRIRARGVGDLRGQLFAYIKAIEVWRAVRGQLPTSVLPALSGDDEI